jgi:hypothetical protein
MLLRLWDKWVVVLEKRSVHPVSPWTVAALTIAILAATKILTRLKERSESSS